jgi:exopolysaccharide biosynthesis WecB/TagA/CpsF family protein
MNMGALIRYCSISFWNASVESLVAAIQRDGGYLVVPAAPALCELVRDPAYFEALKASDFAIIDSGYLALLIGIERLALVRRISGLRFLEELLRPGAAAELRKRRVCWVAPHEGERARLAAYLAANGFDAALQSYYLAPMYAGDRDYEDADLFAELERSDPEWVVIGIAGGKQEKLAFELRKRFGRRFRIVCTGAAMAFLTGGQAKIPRWADRLFLGWLFRIFENPQLYLRRYAAALKMPLVIWQVRRQGKG